MRYLIKFSYVGNKFSGFQRQKNRKSVQSEIENAISIINKKPTKIKGAGRTDALVHAYNQAAHFDLDYEIPCERLKQALNRILNPYININEVLKVSNDFHARFNVKQKKYIYKIWLGEYDPFKADFYLFYNKDINKDKLDECADLFKGVHNFHNFVSGLRDNSEAIIYDIEFNYLDNELDIIFTGKSFYRYMVRNLVGAMLDYNEGKCDLNLIKKMFESDFKYQLRTAKGEGLYLKDVYY